MGGTGRSLNGRARPRSGQAKSASRRGRIVVGGTGVVTLLIVVGLWWANVGHGNVAVVSVRAASSESPTTSSTEPASPETPSTTVAQVTPPPSSPQATRVCEARLAQYAGKDNPMHVTLVAAYASTAADVGADDERRKGSGYQSPWRGRPAGEFEAVCFFDADAFGVASPAKPGAPARTGYDRLEEIVRPDGAPVVYKAAHKNTLNPTPMPSGAGQ